MAMPERRTFFRAMSGGQAKTAEVGFEVLAFGKSKFSARKLIKYALSSTASYTNVPLHFVTAAGVITFPAGLVLAVIAIVRAACGKIISPVLILSMLLALLFGIAFIGMGVLGYYLSRVYDELKARQGTHIEKIGGEGQARWWLFSRANRKPLSLSRLEEKSDRRYYLLAFLPMLVLELVSDLSGLPVWRQLAAVLDLNARYIYYYESFRDAFWGKVALLQLEPHSGRRDVRAKRLRTSSPL